MWKITTTATRRTTTRSMPLTSRSRLTSYCHFPPLRSVTMVAARCRHGCRSTVVVYVIVLASSREPALESSLACMAWHRDAERLIFYRCGFSFFLLFWHKSLRSLNRSQPNLVIYSLMTAIWKIWSDLSRAFTPMGWGQKTLFGTDFELWLNIAMQRNMMSTIGKKIFNLQGLPYMPSQFGVLWSSNGWERLASFCPPPKFLHWETLPVLPHERYITDNRQTSARIM